VLQGAHAANPGKAPRANVLFPVNAHVAQESFLLLAAVGMFAATLTVGARASAAVSGEREAGTWDALLATPLEPHQLLRGKLKGIMRAAVPHLLAFGLPLLALSLLGGVTAFFWTLLLLTLTPLAMFYLGAAGLYASVTCPNSTRSLVWTLLYGYLGAGFLYLLVSILTAILTGIVNAFLTALASRYDVLLSLPAAGRSGQIAAAILISSCLAMGLGCYLAAHRFLKSAEHQLADRDRVRQER
jgi:hypothetical protein